MEVVMKKTIFAMIFLLLFGLSITYTQQVYIAGSDGGNSWVGGNPVYWVNGKQTVLPKIGEGADANGITVSDSDICIAGFDDGYGVVYWLNGKQTVLPKTGTSASANGIAVSGSDIYIVGTDGDPDVNADAVYWLNGKRTALPKTNKSAYANAIFVTQ